MGFANILIAWALSWVALAVAMQAWSSVQARSARNFLEGVLAGLVGLGVLLAIPTILFAFLIGWPVTYLLSGLQPAWLILLLAGPLLALAMKLLMKVLLPNGWQGGSVAPLRGARSSDNHL